MNTQTKKSKFRIKKGDEVVILTGSERGKKGKILRVIVKDKRVLVQGVNMVKRHSRQTQTSPGGIIEKESPVHVSNVALIDPKLGKSTRVGFKILEDQRKVRFAKKSGEVVDL